MQPHFLLGKCIELTRGRLLGSIHLVVYLHLHSQLLDALRRERDKKPYLREVTSLQLDLLRHGVHCKRLKH